MTDEQYKDILDRLTRIEELLLSPEKQDPGPPQLSVVVYEPIKGGGIIWENKIDLPEGKGFANQGRVSGSAEKNCLLGIYDGLVMLQKLPGIKMLDIEVNLVDVEMWINGEEDPPEDLRSRVDHIKELLSIYDWDLTLEP